MEVQSPQGNIQEGQRLMIIKLERYNEIGELLIGIGTTGLQGHICYWDRGQRVSVTMVAVCMGRPLCTQMAADVCHKVQVVVHDMQRVHLMVVCCRVQPISLGCTQVDVVMVAPPVLQ